MHPYASSYWQFYTTLKSLDFITALIVRVIHSIYSEVQQSEATCENAPILHYSNRIFHVISGPLKRTVSSSLESEFACHSFYDVVCRVEILTCSITSGAIQHGVPTNVFRTLFRVMSPPVAKKALTPKSKEIKINNNKINL